MLPRARAHSAQRGLNKAMGCRGAPGGAGRLQHAALHRTTTAAAKEWQAAAAAAAAAAVKEAASTAAAAAATEGPAAVNAFIKKSPAVFVGSAAVAATLGFVALLKCGADLRKEVSGDIKALDSNLSGHIKALDAKLDAKFDRIDAQFDHIDSRLDRLLDGRHVGPLAAPSPRPADAAVPGA
jgi:hypothetical protein